MDMEKYHISQLIQALGFQDLKQSLMVNKKEDNCEFGGWQLQSSREHGLILFSWLRYKSPSQPHFSVPCSCLVFFFKPIFATPGIYSLLASICLQLFHAYYLLSNTVACSTFLCLQVFHSEVDGLSSHCWQRLSKHSPELWLGYQAGMWGWIKRLKVFNVGFSFCKAWSTDFTTIKRRISSLNQYNLGKFPCFQSSDVTDRQG